MVSSLSAKVAKMYGGNSLPTCAFKTKMVSRERLWKDIFSRCAEFVRKRT